MLLQTLLKQTNVGRLRSGTAALYVLSPSNFHIKQMTAIVQGVLTIPLLCPVSSKVQSFVEAKTAQDK